VTALQLRRALTALGLSQSEGARRLGVEQSTMYRWCAGKQPVPGPVVAAVQAWRELAVLKTAS
jgi:transcriptional regulator with XRE-family HTH domain